MCFFVRVRSLLSAAADLHSRETAQKAAPLATFWSMIGCELRARKPETHSVDPRGVLGQVVHENDSHPLAARTVQSSVLDRRSALAFRWLLFTPLGSFDTMMIRRVLPLCSHLTEWRVEGVFLDGNRMEIGKVISTGGLLCSFDPFTQVWPGGERAGTVRRCVMMTFAVW